MGVYENAELKAAFGGRAFRPGGTEITEAALALCDFQPGAVIIDLASGAGATLKLLADNGFNAFGLEKSEALAIESNRAAPTLLGDFHSPPWPDALADGIFCECSLSLAEKPETVLDQCRRLLKDGGRLIISDLFKNDDGPESLKTMGQRLLDRGLAIEHQKDYSRALRETAAALVWELGSLKALAELFPPAGRACFQGADYAYYLLVCRKR
ncbi:class I SAM-dependent methyltransferase [Deltaproteobacteria bacterium OttesenSCG-928-K17]|nr:class I SAM-dependent methyltransferase [Deltaproteobacteria bacterium OttesenSCG-928-K17]